MSKTVDYLSTLGKHTQAVNVVRFDPKGEVLATAGDDGTVLLWTLSESIVREFGQSADDEIQESWVMRHTCRSSPHEIYDLAWSPDSKYIITGSTDNVSRIYDASNGQQVCQIAEHNHYVQGVAWDPLGRYIATQSSDRSVHIYTLDRSHGIVTNLFNKISRAEMPTRSNQIDSPVLSTPSIPSKPQREEEEEDFKSRSSTSDVSENSIKNQSSVASSATPTSPAKSPSPSPLPAVRSQNAPMLNFNNLKNSMLYHPETLESFFRRLAFSPDGSFLFTPSGIFKNSVNSENNKEEIVNTVYIYSRSGLNKPPIAHVPGLSKPALAVSFSPVFYQLDKDNIESPIFKLPYKMIYAVATPDSVVVYDTQHEAPLGTVSNIHYRTLSDLTWNADGESILIGAADGFCSLITFESDALGTKLNVDHRSLLPTSKDDGDAETKMQSPAQLKKRVGNMQITGLIKKKAKPTEQSNTNEKVEEDLSKTSSPTPEHKNEKTETTKSEDAKRNGSPSPSQPQIIHRPLVKQKKRTTPTLVQEKASKTQ